VRTSCFGRTLYQRPQHGKAIREEQDGLRILLDLQKLDEATAVTTLEGILSRLKT